MRDDRGSIFDLEIGMCSFVVSGIMEGRPRIGINPAQMGVLDAYTRFFVGIGPRIDVRSSRNTQII